MLSFSVAVNELIKHYSGPQQNISISTMFSRLGADNEKIDQILGDVTTLKLFVDDLSNKVNEISGLYLLCAYYLH